MTPVYRKMYMQYDFSVLLQVILGHTNKTDLHDITEILLKVTLITITMTLTPVIGYIVQWNLSYQTYQDIRVMCRIVQVDGKLRHWISQVPLQYYR